VRLLEVIAGDMNADVFRGISPLKQKELAGMLALMKSNLIAMDSSPASAPEKKWRVPRGRKRGSAK